MARPKLDQPNFRLVLRGSRFYVRWWTEGAWKRISTGTGDRREATRFLKQLEAGHASPSPPAEPTISEILDGYLEDRKGRAASFATLNYAAKALKRHLGDLQPDHLTRERSRFYARRRAAEGHQAPGAKVRKPIKDGTIIRELLTLRAALKWASRERWIVQIPYVEVPSAPPGRDRWLTHDEADRLLAACVKPHVKVFIALALYTAARSGAILELTWDQVDLDAGVISFGVGRGNKRRGSVPINEALRPILEDARRGATCPWVVEHGSAQVASVKKGFAATCARAGITGATPHTMRHTAVTWMVQRHTPMPMVARYASMTIEMVEKRYGHHSSEWLRQAAEALSPKKGGL